MIDFLTVALFSYNQFEILYSVFFFFFSFVLLIFGMMGVVAIECYGYFSSSVFGGDSLNLSSLSVIILM